MSRSVSQVSPRTVWTIALNLLAIAALLAVLRGASTVVAWVLIALFLSLALDPAVAALHRRGVRRGIAVLGVFVVAAAGFVGLVATLVPMMGDQVRSLVAAAPELLARVESSPVGAWLERFHIVDGAREQLSQLGPGQAASMLGVVAGVAHGALGAVSVTVLTIFMLLFGTDVFRSATAWIEPSRRADVVGLIVRMKKSVGGYVAGSLLIAAIGGVVTAVGMLLLGVPYFLPLGLLMAIMGVIPFLGGAIGAVAVIGSAFATAGVQAGVIALVGWLVYQQIENHLLQPLIQRRTIKMNPLLITLVMLFGTALFGILGALLALPVAGALQVFLKELLARREAAWAAAVATTASGITTVTTSTSMAWPAPTSAAPVPRAAPADPRSSAGGGGPLRFLKPALRSSGS